MKLNASKPFRRYVVIGISVYIFELVVIAIAQQQGASAVAAVGLSFWLGWMVSFLLQKFIAFEDNRTHKTVLLPQLLAYSALVLFNFGFTVEFTRLLQSALPAVACRTLAIGATTIWNFYIYKTRIFKQPENIIY
jgi:putative flippase GtrA